MVGEIECMGQGLKAIFACMGMTIWIDLNNPPHHPWTMVSWNNALMHSCKHARMTEKAYFSLSGIVQLRLVEWLVQVSSHHSG